MLKQNIRKTNDDVLQRVQHEISDLQKEQVLKQKLIKTRILQRRRVPISQYNGKVNIVSDEV